MNILNMEIVKQANGRYALWDRGGRTFYMYNRNSAEEIRDEVLEKAVQVLTPGIKHLPRNHLPPG